MDDRDGLAHPSRPSARGPVVGRRRDTERGAVIVELALILPILVMLVMGIVEFGRAYNAQIAIQSSAREGVRALALRKSSGEATTAVNTSASPVTPDGIALSGCPTTGDGTASVTVTENFTFKIPFVTIGTKTLRATATMRCGA